jgi:hypothetical protein
MLVREKNQFRIRQVDRTDPGDPVGFVQASVYAVLVS